MPSGITRATSGVLNSVTAVTGGIENLYSRYIADAKYFYDHGTVMKNLIRKYDFPDGHGPTYYQPKFDRMTAIHLEESVPIQNAQRLVSNDTLTITPGEIGMEVLITEKAQRVVNENLMRAAGKITGNAMALLEEDDYLTLFSGVSRVNGGTGITLSPGLIQAARARVAANGTEPAPPPYYAVIHDWQYHYLAQDLAMIQGGNLSLPSDAGSIPHDILENYFIEKISGVSLFRDNNIEINASNYSATGCLFSQEAFGRVEPYSMKSDKEWDRRARAWSLIVRGEYGFGEYSDYFAVRLDSDISGPVD